MDTRYAIRKVRLIVLGQQWWIPLIGAVATAAMIVGSFMTADFQFGQDAVTASALGGFVSGVALGRNWIEGAMMGFRAVALGIVVVAVVTAVASFVVWRSSTGDNYFYFSTFLGGMLLLFAPGFGFAGALTGAVGTFLRRLVVPSRFNPPAY